MTTLVAPSRREIMNTAIAKSALNRERVANRENSLGYAEQERIVRGWKFGSIAPRGLIIGQLHSIPKEGRAPEHHDEEWRLGY